MKAQALGIVTRRDVDALERDAETGDCIVNHLLTVHWEPGNHTNGRRRAVVYRLAGDDVVCVERGPGRSKPKYDRA